MRAREAVELCPCGLCLIREPGDVGGVTSIIDQIQWILWMHPNEKPILERKMSV